MAHINDRVRSENFVGVAGALLFTWGIGAVAGPIAIGQLMNAVGTGGLFHGGNRRRGGDGRRHAGCPPGAGAECATDAVREHGRGPPA
ncbi:MAG: hypothetical protein U5L11_15840 [Arhodomonas sp.]|nr:hypothetical protein [Arhodomonas sp.]